MALMAVSNLDKLGKENLPCDLDTLTEQRAVDNDFIAVRLKPDRTSKEIAGREVLG
jgi:hypothetical protein